MNITQNYLKNLDRAKYSISTFFLITIIINLIFYLFKLPDDRGFINSSLWIWNTGDFSSYDIPFLNLLREFILGKSTDVSEIRIGPILPALILLSKKILIGNLFIKIITLILGIINILLIQKIIPLMFHDFNGLDKFNVIEFLGLKIRLTTLDYSCLLGFSLNPFILYYFVFPSTDSFYCTTFFIILLSSIQLVKSLKFGNNLSKKDIKNIWIISTTLFIGMLIRTTAILNFFLIIIPVCMLVKISKKYWKKLILPSIFVIYILIISSIYYLPYANFSNKTTQEWSNGISLWKTPLASKDWELNKLNNIMAHALSFPFKFSELSGLRPSYMTTKSSEAIVTDSKKINESKKPFFYIYLRSNWAFFIVIPSFILFTINLIANPSLEKLMFFIAILSVPLLLTYSIALERYFIHCSSLLACLFLPLVNQIRNSLKKI